MKLVIDLNSIEEINHGMAILKAESESRMTKISSLDMTVRTSTILDRNGIKFLEQLRGINLRNLDGVGDATAQEIDCLLEEYFLEG